MIKFEVPESVSSKDTQIEKDKYLGLFDGVDLFAAPAETQDPPSPHLSPSPDSANSGRNNVQPETSAEIGSIRKHVDRSDPLISVYLH